MKNFILVVIVCVLNLYTYAQAGRSHMDIGGAWNGTTDGNYSA